MAEISQFMIEITMNGADKAQHALARLTEESKKTEEAASSLTTAFKLLGGAMLFERAGEALKNVVMLAARYETLGATLTVMGNNAGYAGAEMGVFQKKLEQTGISALQARQSLQIMAAAQLNLAKASELGRVAQDAATLAGINSSDAFNNLVRGITTGEVRIIRHMGIMVNFRDSIQRYADANHTAVRALNTRQLAEARMIGVLEEVAKRAGVYEAAMTTAGKQMLSMKRYTENLQVQIGELFNPTTNALVFEFVAILKETSESLKVWKESGDMAVFAARIKEWFTTISGAIRTFVVGLWDARLPLEALAVIWASSKLGDYVTGIKNAVTAFRAKINVSKETLALEVQKQAANVITAQQELNAATRSLALVEKEITKNGVKTLGVGILGREAAAIGVVTQKQVALTVATDAAAAAQLALNTAQTAGQRIVSALGGPIGIAIAAIGLLLLAYDQWSDKAEENSRRIRAAAADAALSEKERMTRALETIKLIRKAEAEAGNAAILSKGGKEAEEKRRQIATEMAKIAERNARYRQEFSKEEEDAAKRSADIEQDYYERRVKALEALGKTEEGLTTAQLIKRKSFLDEIEANRKRELNDATRNAEAHKKLFYEAAKAEDALEKLQLGRRSTSSPTEPVDKHADQRAEHERKYLEKLKRELYDSELASQDLNQDYVKYLKAARKLEDDMADAIAMGRSKDGKKPSLSQKGVAQALEDLTAIHMNLQLGEEEVARKRELKKVTDAQAAAYNEAIKKADDLDEATAKLGKTEVEAILSKALLHAGITKESDAYKLLEERLNSSTAAYEASADAAKRRADAYSYAKSIQNKEGSDEEKLRRLREANGATSDQTKDQINLTKEQYLKAWLEIMEKGDSVQAQFVQGSKKVFDTLGEAFGNFVTGTEYSFKKLFRNLADEIVKFYANKAVQELFKWSMGLLMGGTSTATSGATDNPWGVGGVEPRATGGPVMSGSSYIVGEKGPELFTPGASGAITPNNALGGGNPIVNITINTETGQKSTTSSTGDAKGIRQFAEMMGSIAENKIREHQRPGGLLNLASAR